MHTRNICKAAFITLSFMAFSVFSEHVGIDDITGSSTSTQPYRRAQKVVMPEDGNITSIAMYHTASAQSGLKMYLAIYANGGDNKPAARLAITPETDISMTTGWQTINLTSAIDVASGTTLWLAWVYQTNPGIRYLSGSLGYANTSATWSGGMPSTFGTSSLVANYNFCIYANYTTATGSSGNWTSTGGVTWTNDQVGIGTSTIPGGSSTMLAVNGTIYAKEVKVTAQGWPDHVFKPGYDLKPLREVEAFIMKNSHLEGIPSEKEVMTSGVPMGEMQAKLLRKIEETTLYLIEMKKENEQLKARLNVVEQKVR
ncbi:MAG: hypothetical protein JXA71_19835 [Chitinispirillaceae bacterium]|nr:hypothetical protein [Chitinispirillaceae bacterium]